MRVSMSGDPRLVWLAVVLLLVGVGGLLGCQRGSGAIEVPSGEFVAEVEGTVTDTLTGPARHRMEDGKLVGLELGNRGEPGLSIQLEPAPPAPRRYRILEEELLSLERPADSSRGMAFLSLGETRFAAVAGSLRVERADGQTVAATFAFEMYSPVGENGAFESVLVKGQLQTQSAIE